MPESEDRWSVSLSGVILLDRYKVERKMGGGGMATVYLARDEHLGHPVVVKVPHPAFLADPNFRTRFEQETEGLIALQHPHIVRILARGEHEGLPFLVMQFLRGGSLGDRLRKAGGRPLPFEELAPWLSGVTEALDFIHTQGIVHRDIKPDNVLFDEHGYVYLSDFGIAKAIGADDTGLTATGATPGSPAYMAPEQARTSNLGGASDQYSLAASLYEALSGKPAYDGETLVDVLLKKQSEDPPHLCEVAPDVPVAAANAIMRALSRDPGRRFETCAAFLAALQATGATTTMAVPRVEAPSAAPEAPQPAPAVYTPAKPARASAAPPWWWWVVAAVIVGGTFLVQSLSGDKPAVAPEQTPGASPAGKYVLDRAAFEKRLKARGDRPPPRGGRAGRRPDPEAWMKKGVTLIVRRDGRFELSAPPTPGRLGEAKGTWRMDKGEIRFETAEQPGRTPRIFLGQPTRTGLVLRIDRFELPLRRVP